MANAGFHPALKRAGIRRIRFHDLRHTYARLMIRNGEDIGLRVETQGTPSDIVFFDCHLSKRGANIRAALGLGEFARKVRDAETAAS